MIAERCTVSYFKKSNALNSEVSYGLVRKYMNGAVSVESPASSSESFVIKHEDELIAQQQAIFKQHDVPLRKYVKCTCITTNNCLVHGKSEKSEKRVVTKSKFLKEKPECVEIKAYIRPKTCSAFSETSFANTEMSEYKYKEWLMRKDEERKVLKERNLQLKKSEKELKEKIVEEEQRNYQKWLTNKKREQEIKDMENKQRMEVEQKLKQEHTKQKNRKNTLSFQLWLKRKEEQRLENLLENQKRLIEITEEKKERIAKNRDTFCNWLEDAKYKPKPVPSGKGLLSLRPSSSISYINPVPWCSTTD